MTRIEERLSAQLDEKDAEIEDLKVKIRRLEIEVRGSESGWSLPRDMTDDESLPVPRLELAYTAREYGYDVEYRLVYRHLLGKLIATPLGLTTCRGGSVEAAFRGYEGLPDLPFRDGAHAMHDAGHLGLPLYVIAPNEGPVLYDAARRGGQFKTGVEHRREVGGKK